MAGFPRPGKRRLMRGRPGPFRVRSRLLLWLGAWPAAAQFNIGGTKQDKNAPVVFQADEVQYDEQLGLTVAKGHVEISQGGEILLADTVSYNQRTDTVTAFGHDSLLQRTREIAFVALLHLRDSI